jgi:competence protein ComEC
MQIRWLIKKIHPTWHFTAACFGVIFGTVAAQWISISSLCIAIGLATILFTCWRQRRFLLLFALVGGFIVGLARGSIDQQSIATYAALSGKHIQVEGVVLDDIDTNTRGQAVVHVGEIVQEGRQYAGKLWVTLDGAKSQAIQRGDTLTINGELKEGFGNFAGVMQSAQLVSLRREQPGHIAVELRNNFSSHVSNAIDEPASSLGTGYLLGQKKGLPTNLVDALQIVGLTHIVVASGYNLTILVRLSRRLFVKVSKYLSALTSVGLIVGFLAITGLSPSMTRAGLVALLSLWAWYYGRKFHPVTLLAFAAATTVLYNPSYVWGDIGWSLSFAAFAGVMVVAPLMQSYFYGNEEPPFVQKIIGETVSAQLATAPIILVAFGQFSNIAILSNLLILPFIPVTMFLVFIAGIGSYIVPAFSSVVGWPAETVLNAMIFVIDKTSEVEWAQSKWQISILGAIGIYVIIGLACAYMQYKTRYKLYQANIVE